MVPGVNLVLDVRVDDVHWNVELEGVGEGDGQGHHDLHQGGQPDREKIIERNQLRLNHGNSIQDLRIQTSVFLMLLLPN